MVRRRSRALSAAGASVSASDRTAVGVGQGDEKGARWSDAPDAYYPSGAQRGSMAKDLNLGDEERLDAELSKAKRNSRDQEIAVRRAS